MKSKKFQERRKKRELRGREGKREKEVRQEGKKSGGREVGSLVCLKSKHLGITIINILVCPSRFLFSYM